MLALLPSHLPALSFPLAYLNAPPVAGALSYLKSRKSYLALACS